MASTSLGFYSFPSWYLQQEAKSCKRDFQASCFQIKEIFFKLFQMFSYSVKLSRVAKTLNSSNGKKCGIILRLQNIYNILCYIV